MGAVRRKLAMWARAIRGRGLATPWQEWRLPGVLLAARIAGSVVGEAGPPFPIDWFVRAGTHLAGVAFLIALTLQLIRVFWVGGRRDRLIRSLADQGDAAKLSTVVRALDAELRSRPASWRPHLVEPMERLRAFLGRRLRKSDPVQRGLPKPVRKWLYGLSPTGTMPPYADDLITVAEENPSSFQLVLMRDLRDPGAHLVAGPDDRVLQARANRVIDRILGGARHGEDEGDDPDEHVLNLVEQMNRGRPVTASKAEQELRRMGPAAVRVLAEVPVRRRWWWRITAWTMPVCVALLWYLSSENIVPHLPPLDQAVAALKQHWPWLGRWNPGWIPRGALLPYAVIAGAFMVGSWVLDGLFARQRGHVRRTARKVSAALTLIEGPEAADALLDVERARDQHEKSVSARLRDRARLARRLVSMPPSQAADALVPHGGWVFKRPGEGGSPAEWAVATLALIRHAWPPAAVGLLRSWAKGGAEDVGTQVAVELSEAGLHVSTAPIDAARFREEAAAALAELEARIANQGALLRPAAPPPNSQLLRPAAVELTPSHHLVQPASAPEVQTRPAAAASGSPPATQQAQAAGLGLSAEVE